MTASAYPPPAYDVDDRVIWNPPPGGQRWSFVASPDWPTPPAEGTIRRAYRNAHGWLYVVALDCGPTITCGGATLAFRAELSE